MKRLARPLTLKTFEDEKGVFTGYGNVFGKVDHYRDFVEPGAFTRTLERWRDKGRLPALLWQHDSSRPIGVYEAMREDEHGLLVRGRLLVEDVALAREAWALLKAGAINGLSIGFNAVQEERDRDRVNHIKEIDLWEVSLVTFPANEAATITEVKQADPELLDALREHTKTMRTILLGGTHHGR